MSVDQSFKKERSEGFMDAKHQSRSVLMLPWLGHGHISPFLELAKKLAQRNFYIYLCSTPINLKPLRDNLCHRGSTISSIQLIDIHLPSSSELPSHYHTTKDLPPHLMSTLKAAFDAARPAFCDILKTIKPSLVIYDYLQPWASMAACEENIHAIVFLSAGAACCSFYCHGSLDNPGEKYPFPALCFPEIERRKITQFLHYTANGLTNMERFRGSMARSSNIVLIKTSKEIEAKYIDYLSVLVGKTIIPVGPLVQDAANRDDDTVIMDWLSKKNPFSVVFVSFGTEYFLSVEEIEEIAHGLELSTVGFIWVVRFHGGDEKTIHEVLPEGFLQRIGERGMVVEGWAPQAKILCHSSIGGFVSHCGWSSTLEAIMFGVPIIATPMHLDQPLNAKLVVDIGVGMEVKRVNERLDRKEVARVIKKAVVEEEGKELRRKAKELAERLRDKEEEEMDVVVEELVRLVGESELVAQ